MKKLFLLSLLKFFSYYFAVGMIALSYAIVLNFLLPSANEEFKNLLIGVLTLGLIIQSKISKDKISNAYLRVLSGSSTKITEVKNVLVDFFFVQDSIMLVFAFMPMLCFLWFI